MYFAQNCTCEKSCDGVGIIGHRNVATSR
jgi:hypothetical protein